MSTDHIQKRLGILGEPMMLGLMIGLVLGLVGFWDPADLPGMVTKVLATGINLSAVMVLLPRMVKILMEGLIPISEAARTFVQKRAGDRDISIGLDSAILIGHPAAISASLLLVPIAIVLQIVLPGNRVILFADLAVIPFVVALAAPVVNGNVLRMVIIGTVTLALGFYCATSTADLFTAARRGCRVHHSRKRHPDHRHRRRILVDRMGLGVPVTASWLPRGGHSGADRWRRAGRIETARQRRRCRRDHCAGRQGNRMTQSFASFIVPDGVMVNQSAANADEVIGLLADHLLKSETVRDSYGQAVRDRERVLPTGLPVGEGFAVAVPHTDPEHVLTSGIAVATLREPVLFGSMEDPETKLPVRIVFALALRSKDEQIEMLTAIGRLLQDSERLERMTRAQSSDEVAVLLGAVA